MYIKTFGPYHFSPTSPEPDGLLMYEAAQISLSRHQGTFGVYMLAASSL